jgi:hypothetical protein
MLLFIPAAWLIVLLRNGLSRPRRQITPQALCQSTLRLQKENTATARFRLESEVCRVIGWALKCRLYLGRAMPSFFIRD